MELPTIDGHFWIVRDGKIIDWEFNEYNLIRKIHNCNKEKNYIPAPETTQRIMIAMFKKPVMNALKKNWEEALKEFYELSLKYNMIEPQYNRCYQNCLIDIYKNGGELVFGSLGFKKKGTNEYHYEYGGENYKTIKDFMK
jgi:hypothetical protein